MPETSILIATPSPLAMSRLHGVMTSQPDFAVVARAATLAETHAAVERHAPDLVLIARAMTLAPEFEVLEALFRTHDIRWLVLSDPTTAAAGGRRQAADLFTVDPRLSAERLVGQVRSVVRSIRRGAPRGVAGGTAGASGPAYQPDRLVLIGASTGGVDALLTILSEYPENCPPTAIVQHTSPGFTDSLIRLLDRQSPARVVAAAEGLALGPGTVAVGAGSAAHLRLAARPPYRCQVAAGAPVSGHVPSVDALFRSAVPCARNVVAVLLTGMGRDGSAGMLELRKGGATTMVQDKRSSVVYGMPRAAWEIGAAERQLDIGAIAGAILKACSAPASRSSESE